MPWYKQSGAFQRRAAVNHQLRWPFARGDGDLPLPKPVRSAILASKGIWRMSVDASTISPSYPPEARTHGGLDIAPTFPELSPADERGYMSRRLVDTTSPIPADARCYFKGLANHHRCPLGSLAPYSR